ncbi:MAG: hypothetical protein QM736_03570 [Vicinamibacterales bacterium]
MSVRSLNTDFGGLQTAYTNAGGFYEVAGVPVGAFVAPTGDIAPQVLGEAQGILNTNNQDVTVDIVLQNNAVTTPVYLFDGNGYLFDIYRDGPSRRVRCLRRAQHRRLAGKSADAGSERRGHLVRGRPDQHHRGWPARSGHAADGRSWSDCHAQDVRACRRLLLAW